MRRLSLLLVIGALAAWPARSSGEIFVLANGGRVEGTLLNKSESPRTQYIVQTPLGGQLTLSKTQVVRQIDLRDVDRQYEEQLRKSPDTIEGHLALAEWCRENGLLSKRRFHLEQIIERDPDHAAARAALDYTKIDGRWLTPDEFQKSQGYVRYKGRLRLKQDVEAEMAADKLREDIAAWKRKLNVLRVRYEKKGDGGALAEIKAINDPVAGLAFADLLSKEGTREFALLYIDMLGALPNAKGTAVLLRLALHDDDDTIRDACLDVLARHAAPQAVAAFTPMLGDKDNRLINRAGYGLGRVAGEESVPALIEALVTQHKQTIGGGSSGGLGTLSPTFGSGGAGGLTAGNTTKTIIHEIPNDSVLGALRAITRQDFRYDKAAWRAWWVDFKTPKDVNLRRREK